MKLRQLIALCSLLLSSCGLVPQQSGGDILVIGDSVMAYNKGALGDVIEAETNRKVVSRAALGARVVAPAAYSVLGLSIPGQISKGPWNWIVMDGGANDLVAACGCTGCDDQVDALIAPDGASGTITDLIAKARATGAQVLWMGYYQAPDSPSFKNCRAALVEMERRIENHAQSHEGVHFVDAETVFDPADRSLYASDMTHPSVEGSAVLGRFLAQSLLGTNR